MVIRFPDPRQVNEAQGKKQIRRGRQDAVRKRYNALRVKVKYVHLTAERKIDSHRNREAERIYGQC